MNQLRANGLLITVVIHGCVGLLLWWFSAKDEAKAEPRLKMTTIEASLAYKAEKKSTQPQKERKTPRSKVKPKGVSRDETKKVEPKKPDEEQEEDFSKQFEKYKQQRQSDDEDDLADDVEDGDAPTSGGQFDGSEHGFAEVSKGDPYMQELAAEVFNAWEVPTLEKGTGTAEACVRVDPAGKIIDTKFLTPTENANIDRSVDLALKKARKKRDSSAKPVPTHLMDMTTQWICFKFPV